MPVLLELGPDDSPDVLRGNVQSVDVNDLGSLFSVQEWFEKVLKNALAERRRQAKWTRTRRLEGGRQTGSVSQAQNIYAHCDTSHGSGQSHEHAARVGPRTSVPPSTDEQE
jgi:hypothetical protein